MLFSLRSALETMCTHPCMQEYNMELKVLFPKTLPHAGEQVTLGLTAGEELKVFATGLLLQIRADT